MIKKNLYYTRDKIFFKSDQHPANIKQTNIMARNYIRDQLGPLETTKKRPCTGAKKTEADVTGGSKHRTKQDPFL